VSATKKARKGKAKPVSAGIVRRDATIIRELAIGALNKFALYENHPDKTTRDREVQDNLRKIGEIADDLDARTGRRERVLEGKATRPTRQ
jgi:hypothetical protein